MILSASLVISSLLAVINVKVTIGENQKCYVCIPNTGSSIADVIQIFPSGPSLPLCNKFQKERKEYIRECPSPKYVGCLSQTNGTHVTKTCSAIGVEDCKTANKIEYCYCKGHLCNDGGVPVEEARPAVTPVSGTEDDDEDTESYAEGSGSSEDSYASTSSKEEKVHVAMDDIGIELPGRNSATTVKTSAESGASKSATHPEQLTCTLAFLCIFCTITCDWRLLFLAKG